MMACPILACFPLFEAYHEIEHSDSANSEAHPPNLSHRLNHYAAPRISCALGYDNSILLKPSSTSGFPGP
ncbi:hypothetical protein FA13DRAFT_1739455 [Coprinellus micaceus]|uniref:Uncharacterized protein n=1 Tax=Coprinellus micaceus TaxID=71717 RepID=A0A4Y7SS52_COPMI|nr:hypothetical protein FA13DRAFT_1739455 [Coprinellus micaceus]